MKARLATIVVVVVASELRAETISYRPSTTGPLGDTVLADGTKNYSPDTDIEVLKTVAADGGVFWSKRVDLAKGFKLEAYVTRESALQGFGLVVRSPASPNEFSWNWFDREEESVFVKLRGPGRVRVGERKIAGLTELETVEFLEDVRLSYRDNTVSTKIGERTHELLIRKGSVFRMAR